MANSPGVTDSPVEQKPKLADLWVRGVAALVDAIIVVSASYYAVMVWGEPLPDGGVGWQGPKALLAMFLLCSYWVLPEWLIGATVGKLVLGLRVVSASGANCSFMQSLKRNTLRLVDGQLLYLVGYIVAKFSRQRQRLGDQWAKTIVIAPRD